MGSVPKVIGYGEDPSTYVALTKRCWEFLNKVRDSSSGVDTLLFCLLSFGRGGESKALFGEFDAVPVTTRRAYLIEGKWEESSGG